MDLTEIRNNIDAIDHQLVELFCRRMALSAQVAAYKKANNLPIYVPEREKAILQKVAALAGPELESYTQSLYATIFELSRGYQAEQNRNPAETKCGLLGRKLEHSYSPQIHSFLGEYPYCLFEREPDDLGDFLKNGDFTGINVTIPYKKAVIPYLEELSPVASKLGAVNTILRRADGSLFGHNTDYYGFSSLLKRSGLDVQGKKVLILGSGGASNTVTAVLEEAGAKCTVISRSGTNNYSNLHLHADSAVIVNTTPVGMYPNTGVSPVALTDFPMLEGVLDVVYNPARTQLLMDAERLGIPCQNGLWMLIAQAKEAAEYFTGTAISEAVIERIYDTLSREMQNIVLIGMPGCGKSTVAACLAQMLGRTAVDSDARITELAGKSIPEIFAQDGEETFRRFETHALEELGKQSGLVIATGGGCVTREQNYPLLHQNSKIFWLQRSLDALSSEGRPLSQATPAEQMYAVRKPLYEAFADHIVENNGSIKETAAAIIACLGGKV